MEIPGKSGGVCVYIKDYIKANTLYLIKVNALNNNRPQVNSYDLIWIGIRAAGTNLMLECIFRPGQTGMGLSNVIYLWNKSTFQPEGVVGDFSYSAIDQSTTTLHRYDANADNFLNV